MKQELTDDGPIRPKKPRGLLAPWPKLSVFDAESFRLCFLFALLLKVHN